MFRLTILFILSIVVCCYNVEAKVDREVRSTNLDSDDLDINSLLNNSFGNISSIITFLKSQVRDIVIDLGIEVIKFLRVILHDYKVRLFKRLGKYTLSDVFHFIFDGVFEFVGESDPSNESTVENETQHKPSMFDSNYAFPDPYYLEKLIRSEDK